MPEQPRRLNIIAIGAHPDDCEYFFGGTAAKLAARGHKVKFVSVTNGDAGHHIASGEGLAERRRRESQQAARLLGIAGVEVGDRHDGLFLPSLDLRQEIIRQIRRWGADVVLTHRPNDYHPDHRYTSQIVQDSAYLVLVPNVCPDTPVLRRHPVFLYLEDQFNKPTAFSPDIVVAVDDVWDVKCDALDAHASQFYEWLPWADWNEEPVPSDPGERRRWLESKIHRPLSKAVRAALDRRYAPDEAATIRNAEAFELCEYGRQPSPDELDRLFPR